MSLLTSQSLSQIVVETFSRPSQSDDFIVPLEQAMREIAQTQHVTEGTAVELADAILKDVDPDALYRYVCAQPDKINFRSFRDMEFGPFGSSVQRSCLVDELYMHALRAPDAEQRARHARAALVFASLQLVFDSGRTALLLLQQPGFVQTLDLSEQQYRLLRLTVAVHNDRLARVGSSLSAEQTTLRGASDEQVKQFTAELSHLPAFQLTLCNKMSRGFQQRVVDVLKRDRTAYADRSLRYVRRWCLTEPEVAAKAR